MTTLTDELARSTPPRRPSWSGAARSRAAELVEAAIERIEALNPTLNAVVTPMFEQAVARPPTATLTGPFAGVPYLLKDLACEMDGVRFTEGSRFLADNVSTSTRSSSCGSAPPDS